jgi:hypothetical protein
MIRLRDMVVSELRSRDLEVLSVPDDLSLVQTVDWINLRTRAGDIALELHANSSSNPDAKGATAFYIANNDQRRKHAELMLMALQRRVPQLTSRGAKPDTESGTGKLAFCRWIITPSVYLEVAFLTNPQQRSLLQNRRRDFALGIADGLAAWLRGTSLPTPTPTPTPSPTPTPTPQEEYPSIGINLNGQNYGEQGIIVNGNAYVPVELVDSFGIDAAQAQELRRMNYKSIVYVRAVDLREYNVSVGWDNDTRTVILRSILNLCPGQMDRIMRQGNTTEVQLMMFLKSNNQNVLDDYPDIAKLYREEATVEGVNYDIAFCQMCLETDFLRFGGDIEPTQNNFADLGDISSAQGSASFSSARLGVRAQIQHLKAYASTEPLVQEVVDPRFRFVSRGIAPLVPQLSGRWTADKEYGRKIMSLVRRLYESAGLM